ncbi:MAG: hypothetical protein WB812_17830, partial [Woeseiaceae bacterium]
ETGLLVPAGDVGALGGAIAGLLESAQRRERMGAAGRKRMQNEFSIATMADRHVAMYEAIVSG